MNKNAIKKYAIWARRELISRVSQRAAQHEITADGYGDQNASSVHGHVLTAEEKKQRSALITQIKQKGYDQVMEEAAYTWFNRFAALRFMEVNGYLPSHIRVFTNDAGEFKPQILSEAIHLELDGLDMEKVYEMEQANQTEELYRYLLIVQCNALNSILPGMFQRIDDYTELLLPDYLLREGSVIEQMVTMIPEEDWTDQVEIIGWLYQYYISKQHEKVVKAVGKVTISKEDIPAATQLFTPDWITRYMVENSLGRIWLEGHPNEELKSKWKYYLDETEQLPDVKEQLEKIRDEYASLRPESILAIDPCQGSGHILAYMFDVLVQIYEAYGYSARDAAANIVKFNIWGLDIDERASQLAYFSVMMKARQYDRRFFSRKIQPHVYSIMESNDLDKHCIEFFVDERPELKNAMNTLLVELHDAKEYGSILKVSCVDFDALFSRFDEIRNDSAPSLYSLQALDVLLPFVKAAQAMAQKYHAVVTNPPYLNRMNAKLKKFVLDNYEDYSGDLFSVFMHNNFNYLVRNGYSALMTPNVWMFIKTYEKTRYYLINSKTIISLVQLAKGSFFQEAAVDIMTCVLRNTHVPSYKGSYVRLEDFKADMDVQKSKLLEAASSTSCEYIYHPSQNEFNTIEANPISYWCSEKLYEHFKYAKKMAEVSPPRVGLQTGDNGSFLRFWYEVDLNKTCFTASSREEAMQCGKKWFPYNKGGEFRRWYGNRYYVVNWENDGLEIRNCKNAEGKIRSALRNSAFYFRSGITWSDITSGSFSGRFCENGFLFDVQGSSSFPDERILLYVLGFLNSSVSQEILKMLNPTLHTQVGDLSRLPLVVDNDKADIIKQMVQRCISRALFDWNSFEISWNYSRPSLLLKNKPVRLIENAMKSVEEEQLRNINDQFSDEVGINSAFIEIYGLEEEMTSDVNLEDITLQKFDALREIKSLISYAVGCMFGRYSLNTPGDTPGLTYAGGEWDLSKYPAAFMPDTDAIIPICDDEYFEDDIVGRFVEFVKVVYGEDTLEENLRFIADALGGKGSSREVIRNYFISDFYKDHCKTYQKRPIYWLFDSGKKNGFKCLIYLHRYQPDTIARIRTDYVHEQQSRYRTAIEDLEQRMNEASGSERVKLKKQLNKVNAQAEELRVYEEKIHHLADQMISIDLDDGVKHNYAIFQDVLAKIK